MKLLVVGDFHGTFPSKFNDIIRKEKIDLVVSNGDYFPFHYRKLWFKHCYGTSVELWEVVGKRKYKELVLKDLRDGERALKKLDALPVPVITVVGNIDRTGIIDFMDVQTDKKAKRWKWDEQDFFSKIIKRYKNIHRFDYSFYRFEDFIFVGAYGGMIPGNPRSKSFQKYKKKLENLFKKFRKENKEGKVIFVSHNVPYNTKLDKIGMKAHKAVRGKHYGSRMVRQIIDKYHPILHVGGHIHEGMGVQKLGKSLLLNPGSAHENKGAVVIIEKKETIKVRFIS